MYTYIYIYIYIFGGWGGIAGVTPNRKSFRFACARERAGESRRGCARARGDAIKKIKTIPTNKYISG